MIERKNIKWICCQPLTGGMYLGTEKAVGHPAEFILSFPGLNTVEYNKDGTIKNAGNEYHFLKYLQSVNRLPEYKLIDKNPFEPGPVDGINIINDTDWSTDKQISFEGIDLVTAVPVCSGLSMATTAATSKEHLDSKNCNMEWLARYVLKNIQPKIYIFENAPGLVSSRGDAVRMNLERTAKEFGYSIAYYKTDTKLHGVPQLRPRTFVMFIKWRNEQGENTPDLKFIKEESKNFIDFLAEIPNDAPQQDEYVKMNDLSVAAIEFLHRELGDDWREPVINEAKGKLSSYIRNNHLEYKMLEYVKENKPENIYEKIKHYFNHIREKALDGKGYYETMAHICTKDVAPAIIFKNMFVMLNPFEDRLLSMRECLKLMGHPDDFVMYGTFHEKCRKIGQNVPVNTAKWITSEAVRVIENWDTIIRPTEGNVTFFDNTKQKKYGLNSEPQQLSLFA